MDVAKYPLRTRDARADRFCPAQGRQVGGQFWSVYIPGEDSAKQYGYAKMQLEQIDIARRMIAMYPDETGAGTQRRRHRQGAQGRKVASLLGMEGGQAIENSLALLRMYYALGARYMTLTHNVTLDWADAALDNTTPSRHGLTDFGRDVVREMNRLGMIVDLSHVAPSTMSAALDVTTAPQIFSQSSAPALMDTPRDVPDSILARLPKNGGVVMVTFVSGFLKDIRKPAPNATPKDVADHIEHVRKIAGIDHVGLGGDYDGARRNFRTGWATCPGLSARLRRADPPRLERCRPAEARRRQHPQGASRCGGDARPSRQRMTTPKVSTASAMPNHCSA